jgi:ketosteroid isomerase-like protein
MTDEYVTTVAMDHVRLSYCYLDDGDVEGYCSLFTEHAVLRQPGASPITGRDALERIERARQANYSVRHNIYQVFASGRRVAAIGRRRQLRAPYQADVHFVDVFTVDDNGLLNDRTTFLFSPARISMGA